MYLINNIFNEINLIIPTITIKFEKEAKLLDTVDILRESDKYVSAVLGLDSFNTYRQFNIEVIINAGVINLDLAKEYSEDKLKIPYNLRDIIILKQREYIINNYIEKNNYYRTLNGLPNIEDNNFIYLDEETCIKLNLAYGIPIHNYSIEDINIIKNVRLLETLKINYPNKKYLNYLGSDKIDIVYARKAKNFSILQMTKDISDSMYIKFNQFYNNSREYFMTVIYIKEYSKTYDLYDNFIALCIMFMTIQRTFSDVFKVGITRDFYDLESIKMMFESYNVPFLSYLSLDYQRIILKNLNNLLRYKSTDKVLYDLCSLLNFERVRIFSYYLIKEHNLDENKNPLFFYKEEIDASGNTVIVEDVERMYSLYFQLVDISERNVALALENNNNKLNYNEVIVEDPYWIDEEVKDKLYKEDFNFIENKYLSIQLMYKMTEMLFEVIYFLKLLLDKKNEVSNILVKLPKIFSNREFDIFHVVVFLLALISKKNKMAGNILYTPSKILAVMGFNFKNDFNIIRQYINENSNLIDINILNYINNLNITSVDDINNLYVNIKGLNDFIVTKLATSQNIDEYRAYVKLYNSLMVSDETNEIFMKSNGDIATTFLDYLKDVNIDMYNTIISSSDDEISEYIRHSVFRLKRLVTELKYIEMFFNDFNTGIMKALVTFIDFFKSYTTDIASLNVVYLMNSKYFNMIKLIHDIKNINKILGIQDIFNFSYKDIINSFNINISKDDKILLIENLIKSYKTLLEKEHFSYSENKISLTKNSIIREEYNILSSNIINSFNINISKDDKILLIENLIKSYKTLLEKERFSYSENKISLTKNSTIREEYNILSSNIINSLIMNKTPLTIRDNINIIREL